MPRKKSNGSGIDSESAVKRALARREKIEVELEDLRAKLAKTPTAQRIEKLEAEDASLEQAIDEYVLTNYKAGEGYDDDHYKITKVVQHTRTWNIDKLKALVKPKVFKQVTELRVVPAKINELVSSGKLDIDEIESAYESSPNRPYIKKSVKADSSKAEGEAAGVAEALA